MSQGVGDIAQSSQVPTRSATCSSSASFTTRAPPPMIAPNFPYLPHLLRTLLLVRIQQVQLSSHRL